MITLLRKQWIAGYVGCTECGKNKMCMEHKRLLLEYIMELELASLKRIHKILFTGK